MYKYFIVYDRVIDCVKVTLIQDLIQGLQVR